MLLKVFPEGGGFVGVKSLEIRKEILEAGYQPAPKLGEILEFFDGKRDIKGIEVMADPEKFFDRTVVTESMLQIFEAVLDAFEGKKRRVYVLRSFYGGGKTHTLLALIHAFRNPDSLNRIKDVSPNTKLKLEEISRRIKNLKVSVICFAGDHSAYSGNPLSPTNAGRYAYRTVWGYIAHTLGSYPLMKEFDESLTAPQEDVIKKILEGERVLFLFDEVAEYIMSLIAGKYQSYAKSVVNFMEYFCKAVSNSKCVAVITLPFEVRSVESKESDKSKPVVVVDWRFRDLDVITSLRNALEKDSDSFEPIRPRDVLEILKKRLFENIPDNLKEIAVERFKELRVNYPNYFTPNYEDEVAKYYPFSPEYMEVLERLVRETGLQKTRAALEISIDVLRSVINGDDDPMVLKPWHIDLSKISAAFEGRGEYYGIYTKQVLVDEPLHSMILKCIFYYTYYYDTPVPRKEYPGLGEIVRAVYEPEKFSKMDLTVTDIENEIEKVKNREDVLNLYVSEGKFWFWKLPSIRDYINKTAKKILSTGDPRIWDYVKKAIKESYEYRGSKKSPLQVSHGFKELVILDDYEYPEDDEKLRLVVILRMELATGDFPKKIIMESEEGKSRNNCNSLVVVLPKEPFREASYVDYANYNLVCELAAKIVAIDEVEDKLEELYSDREAIGIQEKILNDERTRIKRDLGNHVVKSYSWVLFPAHPDVQYEKITEISMNIAEGVWNTLKKADKVADKLDLSYLLSVIKTNFGIDVEKDEMAWKFKTIKSWFRHYKSLPFVSDEMIEKVVKDGVRDFKFGIRSENNVFFKPVHDTIPPAKDKEGVVPSSIRDEDIVMTKEKAIKEQIEFLLSKETRKETLTHIEEIRYLLYPELGGQYHLLSELMSLPNWNRLFLNGVIVREVRKISKDVPTLEVRVFPGENIEIGVNESARFRISATPYYFVPETVNIEISSGGKVILSEAMNRSNGSFEKDFEVIPEGEEETYSVAVSAIPPKVKTVKKTLRVKVRAKKKRRFETREIVDEHEGYRLLEITDIRDFEVLKILSGEKAITFSGVKPEGEPKAFVDAEIIGKESGGMMELKMTKMPVYVAVEAGRELAEYCTEKTIGKFEIKFENVMLDRRLIDGLKKLNKKVKFTLEREEG